MPKVTVIIPVYKVENYIDECLNAMSRQTYKDFELILVDDGSPDSCGDICEKYAEGHPNTKVIHQENAGLSEARNNGVKQSSGEYIIFIDSDDYVTDDYVEYLVGLIEKYDADVAIGENVKFTDGKAPKITPKTETDICCDSAEVLSKICYNEYPICAWGKIYKRNLVEKFPYPAGALYEDLATTYKIVGEAEKIAYGNRVIYFWRQRKGSITHETVTERHLYGITATKNMLEYIKENYPSAVPAAQVRCANKIIDTAYRIVMGNTDKTMFNRVRAEIKLFVKPILSNKKSSFTVKLRCITLSWGYFWFKAVCMLYSKLKK